jgi:hypothetical protein
MKRRELLHLALGAASLADLASAQDAAPPKTVRVDAYSRTLHWLRKPEEVAEACHQIGNTSIDLTIRAYPGHIQPEKVTTDLPPFVRALERNGIAVSTVATGRDALTLPRETVIGLLKRDCETIRAAFAF